VNEYLKEQISMDLTELCVNIGDRHPGSERNLRATNYVAHRLTAAGLEVSQTKLDCLDWEYGDIELKVGDQSVQAFVGPYNDSYQIRSDFRTAATIDELAKGDFTDKILVLHGQLCKEQLAAKNFIFYNPDHHQQIIALLEEKKPLAVIALTGRNPELTGALYPFPLIEDGDFRIPSVFLTEEEGSKILSQPTEEIYLNMESRRIPSQAYNVIGKKKGQTAERVIFCAHIDTKKGTPGAVDNGGGVCLLLSLADLLQDYHGKYTIEFLVINGEDYYAYPGGMRYLADNQDKLEQIHLVVNSDGVGSQGSRTSYCYFNASELLVEMVERAFRDNQKFIPTEPWYQSDHSMFAMNGIPAVALTTENFTEIWSTIAHTSKDTIDMVDIGILADTAEALREFINILNQCF